MNQSPGKERQRDRVLAADEIKCIWDAIDTDRMNADDSHLKVRHLGTGKYWKPGKGRVRLKPSNIKVTPDGKVKVLDFGLAKAFAGEQLEPSLSASPTLSNLATQQGIILGTAEYMS